MALHASDGRAAPVPRLLLVPRRRQPALRSRSCLVPPIILHFVLHRQRPDVPCTAVTPPTQLAPLSCFTLRNTQLSFRICLQLQTSHAWIVASRRECFGPARAQNAALLADGIDACWLASSLHTLRLVHCKQFARVSSDELGVPRERAGGISAPSSTVLCNWRRPCICFW